MHRTGTKEGCVEGDCGACVELVGELNAAGNGVDCVPVNACIQLLPSLDGKSVKTIESLKKSDGTLHPVQDAMVKFHGSQCGFCTPGIQATQQACSNALATHPASLKIDSRADVPLLKDIKRATHPTYSLDGEIVVQPVVRTKKGSEFVSPSTLAEVAQCLVQNPGTTLLAGSSEIGLQVNKQFARPGHICYLGNVAELKTIAENPKAWRIGAMVSLEGVLALVNNTLPDFAEVLRRFGSPPIRATATLVLRKGDKTRTVALDQFYTGQKQTVLQAGEFIEAIELPKLAAGQTFRAHQVSKRFEQDISATCCALSFSLGGGKLKNVKLAYNGPAPSPCRAPKLEAVLEGIAPADVSAEALDAAVAARLLGCEASDVEFVADFSQQISDAGQNYSKSDLTRPGQTSLAGPRRPVGP